MRDSRIARFCGGRNPAVLLCPGIRRTQRLPVENARPLCYGIIRFSGMQKKYPCGKSGAARVYPMRGSRRAVSQGLRPEAGLAGVKAYRKARAMECKYE